MAPDKLHLVLRGNHNTMIVSDETNYDSIRGVNTSSLYITDEKPFNIPKGFRGYQDTKNNKHWQKENKRIK